MDVIAHEENGYAGAGDDGDDFVLGCSDPRQLRIAGGARDIEGSDVGFRFKPIGRRMGLECPVDSSSQSQRTAACTPFGVWTRADQ